MYSLSLPLCGHGAFPLWCVVEYIRHLEVRRVTRLTRVVLVFGCGLKRDLCCCCLCGGFGLSFFFVAPLSLLAVFYGATAFNQNLSTWNTGAVTNMAYSKCTLSGSLWPRRLPLWCVVEYIRHLEVCRVTRLTRVVLFFVCGLKRDLVVVVCVVGLVFLFFVAPFSLLAVFHSASVFNQNVSTWNTGAVTNMKMSKCTLSLPLCGHGAFHCGVVLNIYDNSSFIGSHFSHVLLFCFVV